MFARKEAFYDPSLNTNVVLCIVKQQNCISETSLHYCLSGCSSAFNIMVHFVR